MANEAPVKTVGEEIDRFEGKVTTADGAITAAAAANKAMSDSIVDRDAEEGVLIVALKKTGPITKANTDGSFSTYRASTSAVGDRLVEETSKGVDTPIEDEATPPDDTGNPPVETPPADNPPAVLGDGSGPNPAEPADPGQPSDTAGTLDAPAHEPIVVTDQ